MECFRNNHTLMPIVIVENVDGEDEECGIIKKLQNISDYDVPDGIEENNTNTGMNKFLHLLFFLVLTTFNTLSAYYLLLA